MSAHDRPGFSAVPQRAWAAANVAEHTTTTHRLTHAVANVANPAWRAILDEIDQPALTQYHVPWYTNTRRLTRGRTSHSADDVLVHACASLVRLWPSACADLLLGKKIAEAIFSLF